MTSSVKQGHPATRPAIAGSGALAPLIIVGMLAVAVGLIAVLAAWRSQGFSAAGESVPATVLTLAAGWGLTAAGIEHVRRGRRRPFGLVLAAAGFAWLFAEWANPAIDSAIGFTAGLVLGWLFPAVVVHALLVFVRDRLSRDETLFVFAGYAVFGVALGLVPALAFDARSVHCSFCPTDLLSIVPSTLLAARSIAVGSVGGAGWSAIAAGLLAIALVRQSPAGRRLRAPAIVPGAAFCVVVAIELGRAAGRDVLPTDGAAHLLRTVEAGLLVVVAIGFALEWIQPRRSRTRVAHIVADLGHSPPLGGLRDALATTLNDPDLRLAYPIARGRFVDAAGRDLEPGVGDAPGRRVTPIVRDGSVVAILEHRADVLEVPATIDEVIRAARLGLEHERLQAETRAQLADLTAARKRIVAAATEERQRLERDLHDGAQQHLIAISIGLRLLEGEASGIDRESVAQIDEASRELGLAIDELREVAHGIYPSVLADEGLAAAIEGLAEGSLVPLSIADVPLDRFDPSVEAAAYAIVAEVLAAASGPVAIRSERSASKVTVDVSAPEIPSELIVELGDRIGAVDGALTVMKGESGRIELVAEIPCAS
jgi:signal transduction histidine kinase